MDDHGRVHVGTNVEMVSFGATICAERAAIARMVADGGRKIAAIAIATEDGGFPCGICLQSLQEFAPESGDIIIRIVAQGSLVRECTLGELFPAGFRSNFVSRSQEIS
jgi:cytidine deaminase